MVPLQELWLETFPVYVPRLSRCMSCLLSGSGLSNSAGISSTSNPFRTHLLGVRSVLTYLQLFALWHLH